MSPLWVLLASIVAGALALALHLALVIRAVGSSSSRPWLRALCLPLPPLAVYVGWRAGARALVYAWALAWLVSSMLLFQTLR